VWPTLSRQDIMAELWLEVKAGSSGRPNAAADAAKFERIYPLLVQVPGDQPAWLAEKAITLPTTTRTLEEAIIEGMQSITAMNQLASRRPATRRRTRTAQGGQGGKPQKPNQAATTASRALTPGRRISVDFGDRQ
jgi:hypothetical protein